MGLEIKHEYGWIFCLVVHKRVSEAEYWDESAQKCHQTKIALGHSRVW